jgi:type II secretory pathway pseudopilin PulG
MPNGERMRDLRHHARVRPRLAPWRRRRWPRRPLARGGGAAGYNLVVLVMAIAVLNVMLAAALPKWSELIQRDKEEELISRGWQYAEAIRVFQRRFQRYPVKLEELIKAKPRCIRQLWKDPMTAGGEWTPIFLNQGAPVHVPGTPEARPSNGLDPNQPQINVGPIVGVRSRSSRKSLLVFFGHERYDEWEFRVEMLARQAFRSGGAGIPGGGLVLSTRWLGRPMPNFMPPGGPLSPTWQSQPPGGAGKPGAGGSGLR